jgi:hypothetical protein
VTPGRVVLVVGPRLAGVDGVAAAVGRELPDHRVVGVDGLAGRVPDAVLAVLSAVAPATRTDWDAIGPAAACTDLVIGVVAKIDAHRGWRAVMDADRTLVAGWSVGRAEMPWVGVAAAPDLGEARVGELVVLLRERLADRDLDRRNAMRRDESLGRATRMRRVESDRRPSAGGVELRRVLQRTRLRLSGFTRDRCSALRSALREEASRVPEGGSGAFEDRTVGEAHRFVAELDDEIGRAVAEAAAELAVDRDDVVAQQAGRRLPSELCRSPSSSRRLEGRLMAVLGLGFGLGVAVASSRLVAGMAPGAAAAGWVIGLAVGLAVVAWVVRVRAVLHDRAVLDRWVTEVAASLRWHGEAVVSERLLAVESAWAAERSGGVRAAPEAGRENVTELFEW